VVFKAQHRDVAPGYPAGNPHATPTWNDLQAHMTQYSNDRCVTSVAGSQAFPLGPYLQRVPANPLTSVSKFFMVPNGQPMPTTYQGTDYGWIYKAETQEIVANSADKDANGVPYIKY
jgi:hypothetical protein